MDERIVKEYADARTELIKIQECITEFMKMFFAAGVVVVALAAFVVDKKEIMDPEKVTADAVGYCLIGLHFTVLAFSTILFHKFNSHNRYSGYVRTLGREMWDDESASKPSEYHLWEAALAKTNDPGGYPPIVRVRHVDLKTVILRIRKHEKHCRPTLRRFIQSGLKGLWMIARATIVRSPTRSWSYPFQVGFGLFIYMWIIALIWVFYPARVLIERHGPSFWLQLALFVFLIASWLGLGFRMYRLCAPNGDRTIEHYSYTFMISRYRLLWARGIRIYYL